MKKIGKIVNTQGIKGELRVLSNSDFKDIRFAIGSELFVQLKDEMKKIKIINHYTHKNFDIIKVEGYNNINDVLFFKNKDLFGEELTDEILADDEFFYEDIIGLEVFEGEEYVGKIKSINDSTSQMLFRIVTSEKEEFYIPNVEEFIKKIDIDNQKMEVSLIKGMRE